jgi:serine/threonine-protein kinase
VLFERIGEGGMARLFLARGRSELGSGRLSVVKLILPIFASSAEFSRLLIEEAKLAAKLSHGSIVQVTDLGREGDSLYIAMEYVEGFDLSELLRRCSRSKVPLPIEFSLFVLQETLRALDYAHKKRGDDGKPLGIVHRDVSPSNVLVSFDGQVKLCDFGIARAMGVGSELPKEAIQGKAGYMSPEAARGDAVDARSDVFAAGVIAWELLAGRRLYKSEKGRSPSLEQARDAVVPELPRRGHPNEEELIAIVQKALAKDPADRFKSARDMLKELDAYVADSGLVTSPMRFGEWLTAHFGAEILEQRAARERAAQSLGELSDPKHEPPTPPSPPSSVGYAHAEPPPPSLMAVVHSTREPTPSAREPEPKPRNVAVWIAVAIVAVVVAVQLLSR